MRRSRVAVMGLLALLSAAPAWAAGAPQIKLSGSNAVLACTTPERLMQTLAERNPRLDPRLREIAALYEQHGAKLGVRWDFAFFQMAVETNYLTFEGSGAKGGVTAAHNNFAGISTPDGSEPDKFADAATGVQAHLHHIRLYAGDPVAKPAARRTKQVEGYIAPWARGLKRPVGYSDMLAKWAPNNAGYARAIETAAAEFQAKHCAGDPGLVVASAEVDRTPEANDTTAREPGRGKDARRQARNGGKAEKQAKAGRNKQRGDQEETAAAQQGDKPDEPAAAPPMRTATAAGAAGLGGPVTAPGASAGAKPPLDASTETQAADAAATCKVWSASFGGDKSVLIRVSDGPITHFTALQVNAGREKEETTAYIAAYARGGRTVGEFTSADQAINKAFELCPKT